MRKKLMIWKSAAMCICLTLEIIAKLDGVETLDVFRNTNQFAQYSPIVFSDSVWMILNLFGL